MFAILISKENFEKIEDRATDGLMDYNLKTFTNRKYEWYYIVGYYHRGRTYGDVVLPEHALRRYYEFDADKIRTEWDQIVRIIK